MRVIVIGGSGHIGTYLTPRLVEEGHNVVSVFVTFSLWFTECGELLDGALSSIVRAVGFH